MAARIRLHPPRDENSANGMSRPHKKAYFKDFAHVIQKALSYVKEAHVWRMQETLAPSWVSKSGKVVLAGDAAHAVLPYVGQVNLFPSKDRLSSNNTYREDGDRRRRNSRCFV